MFEFDDSKALTDKAMNDPQPGDRFTEMYAFWVYVIKRENDLITFIEANPPCTLPEDGSIGILPLKRFKSRYAYGSIPGYSIRLIDRGNDVSGWDIGAKKHIEIQDEFCPCCGKKYK